MEDFYFRDGLFCVGTMFKGFIEIREALVVFLFIGSYFCEIDIATKVDRTIVGRIYCL